MIQIMNIMINYWKSSLSLTLILVRNLKSETHSSNPVLDRLKYSETGLGPTIPEMTDADLYYRRGAHRKNYFNIIKCYHSVLLSKSIE
jgi:hypothetical protein